MNPYFIPDDSLKPLRSDGRVTEVTFTLPAGHKWTTAEAALREAHDVEANLRLQFQFENDTLKDEVERLKSENLLVREESDRHYGLWVDAKAEIESLTTNIPTSRLLRASRAENERLIIAGDAMAEAMDRNGCHDNGDWDDNLEAIAQWKAAKDGTQTK